MAKADDKHVSALKRLTTELRRTREYARGLEEGMREPIAIVGMSCRYPGGVASPRDLWNLVAEGGDGISSFPTTRGWDLEELFDPDPDSVGTSYSDQGGFLPDAGEFDPAHFGISPREALAMDPQQRLLLEGAWEALEDAAVDPRGLRGSRTGVFAGLMYHDYSAIARVAPKAFGGLEGYLGAGNAGSVLTGRLAYSLGLEGPAVTIDTACSSSLVAMHLAAQSLRQGECELALAGGVTVMATPSTFIDFSRQRGLARDGRCKSFAEAADGTGWSEGSGVVVLERLSDAERNGHEVLAVIRGSAVNQDGASNGLTAPNGPSQERVIMQALANAGLSPQEVDAVEAHGTGTTLGDPIEAQALLATYGQEREQPLRLGSIKSNIGHAQAAAGVGGVIKMVQALRHEELPRTLHVDRPSSHVDWEAGNVELLTEPREWKWNGRPRRAGISSFGVSGTNAHLIVEEAPTVAVKEEEKDPLPALPFLLAASGPEALAEGGQRLASHLRTNSDLDLGDVAATLATGRAQLAHRAVAVGSNREELIAALDALAAGEPAAGLAAGEVKGTGKLAFLFTGQGAQRPGMGRELAEAFPVFAAALDAACGELDPYLDRSLRELIFAEPESKEAALLDRTEFTQPALFALEVALFRLFESLGLRPDYLLGHSIGEVAAAHAAGVIDFPDAAKLVAARGALMGALPAGGAMVALEAGEEEVAEAIKPHEGRAEIAGVNSPASTVVSGIEESVLEIQAAFEERGRRTKRLAVSHAFHSPLMEPILAELEEAASSLAFQPPKIPIVSDLTGEILSDEDAASPSYWARQAREAVRFADGVAFLQGAGVTRYLELGPDGTLGAMAAACLEEQPALLAAALREDRPEAETFLAALGAAHASGARVDWEALLGRPRSRTELPTYPFQRRRFWLSSGGAGAGDLGAAGLEPFEHPLLTAALPVGGEERWLFSGRISAQTHSWLADHAVLETVLLPGTAFLELALAAGERAEAPYLEELALQAPLLLPEGGAVQLQLSLAAPDEDGRRSLAIHSRPAGEEEEEWTLHAEGTLSAQQPAAPEPFGDVWPPEGAEELETDLLYERLEDAGYRYGPAFQGLERAWRLGEEIFAEVALGEEAAEQAGGYGIHPALLDAALHAMALRALGQADADQAAVPFSFSGVSLQRTGAASLRVRLREGEGEALRLDACEESGAPLLSVETLRARPIDAAALGASAAKGPDSLFELDWIEAAAPAEAAATAAILGEPLPGLELESYSDLGALEAAEAPPQVVLLPAAGLVPAGEDLAAQVQAAAERALEALQRWIDSEALADSKLVLLTEGALSTSEDESPDLAQAALVGLLRSARSEHPGRFGLIDADGEEASLEALPAALASEEPELCLRGGRLLAPRLARAGADGALTPPPGREAWHLEVTRAGTLENLALVPHPRALAPLGPNEVRVAVGAAGLNFRDVLVALGIYPGDAELGSEGSGVVAEVGSEVEDLAPGERVAGLFVGCFGPLAVTDRRLLAKVPEEWTDAEAAGLPTVFLTALYALGDLAALQAGEKVLIHGAAGGVGTAAVQIARHLGAEVFATAHPDKWGALAQMGIPPERIASSRDLQFKEKFLAASGGGLDVVLDSLAGEFVDASLELLGAGGRFVEMGKTDVRDPAEVAAARPGASYRAFDLQEAGPERLGEMLEEVVGLFEAGVLRHPPITSFDLRRAPEAFRFLRESRHVGKVVLALPPEPDPQGTVLLTGATGGLGALVARHLVKEHGARHLLLLSRSGPEAPGAAELQAELEELGAEAVLAACDVADEEQLAAAIQSIPPERPLASVFHCAGVLDDGVLSALDPARLAGVMDPKVKGALNLHRLTEGLPLARFVCFSSVSATLGSPGQANYAAANSFLDALAAHRRSRGLPGLSLAWGAWERGMVGALGEEERGRLSRIGIAALSDERGLELLDASLGADRALLVPAALETSALRAHARAGVLPAVLGGLVRAPRAAARGGGELARLLASAPQAEWEAVALEAVRGHVAAVLGHGSGEEVDPRRAFGELGFDSLAAVELRNRLGRASGMRLPATLVFDHPSAAGVAAYLCAQAEGKVRAAPVAKRLPVRSEEPIAIVGMSCRYPGGAASPEQLWQLVAEGRDAISELPADRGWDLERLYDPDPDHPGTSYARHGGFLYDAGDFDPAHFGISPREALAMDPQQRLLLEGAWEALEEAGIDPHSLRGSMSGVFAGVAAGTYGIGAPWQEQLVGLRLTGSTASVASGRLAYTFGLEGPAITVDTACSSSLVAMHLAGQALRNGECDLALAGGAMVMAAPESLIEFSRQRGLAPDGRCKSFAEAADGTGWSEGSGVLVLERLSDAERHGHEVLAVIRGSAVNQDGASNGLTAPNGPSQERVIMQALANSGLSPQEVDAVEAHGTGTTLGDPIEAQALLATYGQEREQPLRLGSIKSNIGHTVAAAGVGGVIKMVQALRHEELPRTLHVDRPSSHVDWESGEVELLTETVEWKRNGRPRRAGISSFGISGTNVHLIVEEAPVSEGAPVSEDGLLDSVAALPLLLSAKTKETLSAQAERLASHLRGNPGLDLRDAAAALATGRAQLAHRAVAVGAEREELLAALDALAADEPSAGLSTGEAKGAGKLAFLFTGQGAQRPGMGRELAEAFPVFAAALDAACGELDSHLDRSLQKLIFAEPGSEEAALLDCTEFTQPALLALEVALFRLLESLGLRPDYLLGHSIGELAAAHVAGVIDLPDAAKLVAARGALMGALPEGGAMVALEAAEEEVAEALESYEGRVETAGLNGPASTVVSGEEDAVLEIQAAFEERGRRTKRLAVSHAFHSPLMEPILAELEEVASGLDLRPPKIPIVSDLSGDLLTDEEATSPSYWARQARGAVRFAGGVSFLERSGATRYLELGPDGTLGAMAAACLSEQPALLAAALREDRSEPETFLAALGAAHSSGARVDWEALLGRPRSRTELPTYPFQRRRFWLASGGGAAGDLGAAGLEPFEHPLLTAALPVGGEERWLFSGRISAQTHPWLTDHAVLDAVLLPGTAFLELALAAGERAEAPYIEELALQAPLVLPQEGAVQLQLSLAAPDEEGRRGLAIHSRPAGEEEAEWTLHAEGTLSAQSPAPPEPFGGAWPPEGAEELETDLLYERLEDAGYRYGPAFQGLQRAWRVGEEVFAEVALEEEVAEQASGYGIHPALLDSALHAMALRALEQAEGGEAAVPFSFSGVSLQRTGAASLRVRLGEGEGETLRLDAFDGSGAQLLSVERLRTRPIDAAAVGAAAGAMGPDSLFELDWREAPVPASDLASGAMVLGEPVDGLELEACSDLDEIEAGETPPQVVLLPAARLVPEEEDLAAQAQAAAERALEALQRWIDSEHLADSKLVLLTEGALSTDEEESPNLAQVALVGLLRSARSEHPGRFGLVDADGEEASLAVLPAALQSEEPELCLREGRLLAPRLARAKADPDHQAPAIDPEGTVLVTGGTGGLGALVARHLVSEHGARRLLLLSRSGPEAPGAAELQAELEELGAEAAVAACDVADEEQLAAAIEAIPPEHPLAAVVHTAGLLDDGVVSSLDPERLARVMAPKVQGAINLHRLTEGAPLTHFVLFSSVAAILGSPGQANYAAANSFLDALAFHRRARGLPAVSLAWGAWETTAGMAGELGDHDLQRLARIGIAPLSDREGLELFDTAVGAESPLLAPAGLEAATLRQHAKAGVLPPILSGLVRVARRAAGVEGELAKKLGTAPESEWERIVLELVRSHVAAVLGHASAAEVDPQRAFQELGFDSLAAVELRNRLSAAAEIQLPATLVFDHPTTLAVAGRLLEALTNTRRSGAAQSLRDGLEDVERVLMALPPDDPDRVSVMARLRGLVLAADEGQAKSRASDAESIQSASDDDLFELIDNELESASSGS